MKKKPTRVSNRCKFGYVRITVWLPLDLVQKIEFKSKQLGISVNQYVVNVLKKAVGMS